MSHTCTPWKGDDKSRAECLSCRAQDGITCSCPGFWFPAGRREQLRKLPHGFGGGILMHHHDCAKAKVPGVRA